MLGIYLTIKLIFEMFFFVHLAYYYVIGFENSNLLSVSLIDINFFLSVWSVRINDFESRVMYQLNGAVLI